MAYSRVLLDFFEEQRPFVHYRRMMFQIAVVVVAAAVAAAAVGASGAAVGGVAAVAGLAAVAPYLPLTLGQT